MSNNIFLAAVKALDEDRIEDAALLLRGMVDEDEADPLDLLSDAATTALMLYRTNRSNSLGFLLNLWNADEHGVDLQPIPGWDIMDEALHFLELREGASGEDTAESDAILSRFDQRPGSAEATKLILSVAWLLLDSMRTQMMPIARGDRSPEETLRASLRNLRAWVDARDSGISEHIMLRKWDDPRPS